MTNNGMAKSHLAQAAEILIETESHYARGVWNLTVRRAQEVVELSLKAALVSAGLQVPRVHDVGVLLKEHAAKFPDSFRAHTDRLASISRRLRREREISFYGDDETGAPAQELYIEADARAALEDARYVLNLCRALA